MREALQRSNGSVKIAVLLLQGYDLDEAEAALEHVGGRLRVAIDHLAKANGLLSPTQTSSATVSTAAAAELLPPSAQNPSRAENISYCFRENLPTHCMGEDSNRSHLIRLT